MRMTWLVVSAALSACLANPGPTVDDEGTRDAGPREFDEPRPQREARDCQLDDDCEADEVCLDLPCGTRSCVPAERRLGDECFAAIDFFTQPECEGLPDEEVVFDRACGANQFCDSGWSDGYEGFCAQACERDGDCDGGRSCFDFGVEFTSYERQCLFECNTDDDCPGACVACSELEDCLGRSYCEPVRQSYSEWCPGCPPVEI